MPQKTSEKSNICKGFSLSGSYRTKCGGWSILQQMLDFSEVMDQSLWTKLSQSIEIRVMQNEELVGSYIVC